MLKIYKFDNNIQVRSKVITPRTSRFYKLKNHIQLMKGMGKTIQTPVPEKLEYGIAQRRTTCVILLNTQDGALIVNQLFESGGGLHAEEKAIQYLTYLCNEGFLEAGKIYELILFISKSPCSSTCIPATRRDGQQGCIEKLNDLRLNGLQSPNGTVFFDIKLAPTKYYSPHVIGGKNASKEAYRDFSNIGDHFGPFK